MSSKRILVFSTAYYPFVGGAEVAIKEITDRIPEIQFDLITARMDKSLPQKELIGRVMVYRIGFGNKFWDKFLVPYLGALKTWQLHSKNNYSVFWCMMATYASGAAYIFNILSRRKVPIILTLQEGDSEAHLTFRWFGMLHLSWYLALRRATRLTVISNYLKTRAQRLGFRGRIELIPNGVSVDHFVRKVSLKEIDEAKTRIGKKVGDIILASSSRLVKKNGLDDIIKALPHLSPNIKFFNWGVGEDKEKLEALARKLNVFERVRLYPHNPHELPINFRASDIFIRPSLSEGQGISFLEGMMAGLPVIATPVGGIIDFVFDPDKDKRHPPTGLFVNVRDPEGIARQVKRILSNKQLALSITTNAKRLVREKYDWDIIAEQMKKLAFEPIS